MDEVETLAKLICSATEGIDVNTVIASGAPWHIRGGGYVIPSHEMQRPLWSTYIAAANAVLENYEMKEKASSNV